MHLVAAAIVLATVAAAIVITLSILGTQESVAADPLITSVEPATARQFAAFNRPLNAKDRLVNPMGPGVERQAHANRALARRGDDESTRFGVWLVPGENAVCGVVKGDADESTLGESCQSLVDAAKGFVFTLSGGSSGSPSLRPHEVVIAGVVPDGIPEVILTMANGARRGLPVQGNTYLADVDGATSTVSYIGTSGTVTQQATSYEG